MDNSVNVILSAVTLAIGKELTEQERKHITDFIILVLTIERSDGYIEGAKEAIKSIRVH